MSTLNPSTFDSLALVNSFYGPGATACWYLTCLSCLISWTLQPKKQTSDSITSDFIALVTFPTVAAAHLIPQVQNYPSQSSLEDQLSKQIHASMSASLTITETSLSLCIIILTFKRPQPCAEPLADADPEVLNVYRVANKEHDEQKNIHRISFLAILFLPLSLISDLDLVPSLSPSMARMIPTTGRSLVHEFFPETDTGIVELDQAVALLAGMTVLGFSLYSTADGLYKAWWEKERMARESAARRMVDSRARPAEWMRARKQQRQTQKFKPRSQKADFL
ncbi:hypothetical protein N431DRAFT_454589 [Stipitochalara longipes BDJ]|nr:hypothetical protein N431DRAFT_454589 [Stipitochalara longipes BDJ]